MNDNYEAIQAKFKEEVFNYLDDLRESGVTNMFGAPAYLVAEFDMDKKLAIKLTTEWMETFSERQKGVKE